MVYVVTGGPGFGKTTLLNLLSERGFPVGDEKARELLVSKGELEAPDSSFPKNFEKLVAEERISFLQSVSPNTIAFSDRGLPDQVAYSRYKGKEPSGFIIEASLSNRYAPTVFITPPWEEIYVRDEVRRESFEDACNLHNLILKAYLELEYELIDLPLLGPEKRAEFILSFLEMGI
jgi:predicted ATPase